MFLPPPVMRACIKPNNAIHFILHSLEAPGYSASRLLLGKHQPTLFQRSGCPFMRGVVPVSALDDLATVIVRVAHSYFVRFDDVEQVLHGGVRVFHNRRRVKFFQEFKRPVALTGCKCKAHFCLLS